jgi:hypothetical protein
MIAWAMFSDRKASFQALLDNKANPNAIGNGIRSMGHSVLAAAVEMDDSYWLNELIKHGGDVILEGASI